MSTELKEVELKCLVLASDGLSISETATEIGESQDMVKKIRRSAFQKLGADSMPQAVAMAMRRGLIT